MSEPEQAEIRAEVEAADVLVIGDGGGDAGVVVTRFDRSDAPPDWDRHATVLSKSSPIASELARLGISASTSPALYQMVVPASVQKGLLTGAFEFANNVGRAHSGPIRDAASKQFMGHAGYRRVATLSVVGPQLAWAVAAYAVGQHFMSEISSRLSRIEDQLSAIHGVLVDEQRAQLRAATVGCERATAQLIDGAPAESALPGLSAQTLAIDTAWARLTGRLDEMSKSFDKAKEEKALTRKAQRALRIHLQVRPRRFRVVRSRLLRSARGQDAVDPAQCSQDRSDGSGRQLRLRLPLLFRARGSRMPS